MRRPVLAALLSMLLLAWPAQAQLFPTNPFPSEPQTASAPQADSQPAPSASLADFAGGWWHHGFGLKVKTDGTGEASWRVYRWCRDSAAGEPCDGMHDNLIENGGNAIIIFDSFEVPATPRHWKPIQLTSKPAVYEAVQLPIAHGRVIHTTDPRTLRLGAVDLVTLPYDTGTLVQDGDGVILCRPDDPTNVVRVAEMTPAQRERWEHRACGA
jgi:hypothetical protein